MSDETPDTHVDGAEPSMEDILASIRRIIADEDGLVTAEDGLGSLEPAESFTILEAGAENKAVSDISRASDAQMTPTGALSEEETLSEMDLLLSELDGSADEAMDVDLVEDLADQSSDEPSASPLAGLGAVAAASLGALASAGIATADSITGSRNNPKPEPTDAGIDSGMRAESPEDLESESFDLLLDSEDIVNEFDADDELESLLQIPDNDEEAPADDIEALLEDLLFDDVAEDTPAATDERVVDPAADMIDAYEPQSPNVLNADNFAADAESSDEMTDELLAELLDEDTVPDAAMAETAFHEGALPETQQSTDDLDLVKSLMADLTAVPYDASDAEIDGQAEAPADESDFVDEILSMSMEDETGLKEDAIPADTDAFVIDMQEDVSGGDATVHNAAPPSLAAIAQAATADADNVQRRAGFGAAGFAAGAGMLITSIGADEKDESAEIVDENVGRELQQAQDVLTEINHLQSNETAAEDFAEGESGEDLASNTETKTAETLPQETILTQETAEMPKAAAKQDAIIDEVTEEATAGAFASLNQIVENNAVVEERGDRIGDLVQEALRPMLKEWLDKNLKGIVERAVTKEVKRISTGK